MRNSDALFSFCGSGYTTGVMMTKSATQTSTHFLIVVLVFAVLLVGGIGAWFFVFSGVPPSESRVAVAGFALQPVELLHDADNAAVENTQAVLGNAELVAQDDNADRDADNLPDAEEKYYGANAGSADTDGDGYADGNEVARLYSPADNGRLSVAELVHVCNSDSSAVDTGLSMEVGQAVCTAAGEIYGEYLAAESSNVNGARTELAQNRTAQCDALYEAGSSENFYCSSALLLLFAPLETTASLPST